ncbi:MAG TPA: hypothetical protein VGL99_26230 [Chloroflexota bacterium]
MPRFGILVASFGLAVRLLLWSVPGLVAASGAVQLLWPSDDPNPAERLRLEKRAAPPSVQDALVGLIGAEVEAMEVAGVAIENPHTPRLAERADSAGERVLLAVRTYVRAVQAALRR